MAEKNKISRIPPHDLDAEQATLGSIMLNPSALNEIVDIIQFESFYSEKHRIIFKAMIDLFSKNEPIDLLSLSTSLKNRGQLEQIGGRTYLSDLTSSVPASTNVKHYAGIVYKKALMRKLIEAGEHLATVGFTESDMDVETLMDDAEKRVFSITGDPKGQKFVSLKQTVSTNPKANSPVCRLASLLSTMSSPDFTNLISSSWPRVHQSVRLRSPSTSPGMPPSNTRFPSASFLSK